MTNPNLQQMSIEQLIDSFAEMGIAQYKAMDYDEYQEFNDLYKKMNAINNELKSRHDESRLALLALYRHPNIQVRLAAAARTLAVAPVAARNEIEAIANSRCFPQAGHAGMTLSALDNGTFKPS